MKRTCQLGNHATRNQIWTKSRPLRRFLFVTFVSSVVSSDWHKNMLRDLTRWIGLSACWEANLRQLCCGVASQQADSPVRPGQIWRSPIDPERRHLTPPLPCLIWLCYARCIYLDPVGGGTWSEVSTVLVSMYNSNFENNFDQSSQEFKKESEKSTLIWSLWMKNSLNSSLKYLM